MRSNTDFAKTAQKLARNPLGIIALFIVLVYSIAATFIGISGNHLEPSERLPLIWFLVIFPVIVLLLFIWLVIKHHTKLYSPSDFKNDESFLRTLSYEEQKLKINNEIRLIKDYEDNSSISTRLISDVVRVPIKPSSIMLIEDLVLRDLEITYGNPIRRQVAIGTPDSVVMLDGAIIHDSHLKRITGIEIKFAKNKTPLEFIDIAVTTFNKIANMGYESFNLIFAVVIEDDYYDIDSLHTQLNKKLTDYENIKMQILSVSELQRKFGVNIYGT